MVEMGVLWTLLSTFELVCFRKHHSLLPDHPSIHKDITEHSGVGGKTRRQTKGKRDGERARASRRMQKGQMYKMDQSSRFRHTTWGEIQQAANQCESSVERTERANIAGMPGDHLQACKCRTVATNV